MTAQLGVADIISYLHDNGWQRVPVGWRGASIWSFGDDYEVVVPGRDGMGDGDLRVREIVDVLVTVERRPREEIVFDIGTPWIDTQLITLFPEGLPAGCAPLRYGLRALTGMEGALRAAARSVVEGPHLAFRGEAPSDVERLLARIQIGTGLPGSYVIPVRVPLDDPRRHDSAVPLGRHLTMRFHTAVSVLSGAAGTGREDLDGLVAAEISADLCESLGDLGGERGRLPFEIAFRWARGLPSQVPASTYGFPSGAGVVIRTAAEQLRRLSTSGTATVTGLVRSLHDDEARDDRWLIEVRGDVVTTGRGRSRRAMWVRLPNHASYETAISAHRASRRVRVRGVLASPSPHAELTADQDGLEVLD